MSSNSFNTSSYTVRKPSKYLDNISPSDCCDNPKRNVQKIVLIRKIQKKKDDKKTSKKHYEKLSPDLIKKNSFKNHNSKKEELRIKNSVNKTNIKYYKINYIHQKKKRSCMNKPVNLLNNKNPQSIKDGAQTKNKTKKKKSEVQYVTYIQLWWKTIYQIIKIQKYLRGYLYRIRLLKTLEINQKVLYGLIGFSKVLKKIIYNNLVFSIYETLFNKLKYYFHKWNDIITRIMIIRKLKNYTIPKKVIVKRNKTRKDNNAAIKNLIKKIKAYRETKKKHFKVNSSFINNSKLSKGKHTSKNSNLTHSLSKKSTVNSNKIEIGRLTPYVSHKKITHTKSSSTGNRILKNNRSKKPLIKNNTNNHSMEKRIKQNKKDDIINKELSNRNYMNNLSSIMNSNIKKYMNNIKKKDSFGNYSYLSNISINSN